jgi:hypothetical protein
MLFYFILNISYSMKGFATVGVGIIIDRASHFSQRNAKSIIATNKNFLFVTC